MVARIGKIVIGGVALIIVILIGIGLIAPREYRGSITRDIPRSPDAIYTWLTDFEGLPRYRPEISAVEMGSNNAKGFPMWTQFHGKTSSIFQAIEMVPKEHLAIQTVTSNSGLAGTWSYSLSAGSQPGTTSVTITEVSDTYTFLHRIFFTVLGRKHRLNAEMKALEYWAQGS